MPHPMELAKFITESSKRKLVSRIDLELFEAGTAVKKEWSPRGFVADPFFRLYLVTDGKTELLFADGVSALKSGQLHLIPANVPFRYVPHEFLCHHWLHFCSSALERLPHFQRLLAIPVDEVPHALELMEELLVLMDKANTVGTLMRMDIIVRRLLTPFLERLPDNGDANALARQDTFSQVFNYIDSRLDQSITAAELAALAKMKPNEFSAAFRQAFGTPPKQYLTRRRVDRAKILLISTGLPIKEVAARVGYDNEFFFYRIFRKTAGMTPNEYRQMNSPCR